jgi:prepilin signal peptidase PulO-like enzyme (type II secretory pathway)
VIAVGFAVPLAALAVWRSRMVGDDLRGMIAAGLIGLTFLATAWIAHPTGAAAIALAYGATCAWTDMLARRVYLPVSAFAGAMVVGSAIMDGHGTDAAVGGLALGGFGLALHLVTKRRGFGFGDVTSWAIVGCALGVVSGLQVVAAGSIIGSVVVVGLIVARVVTRRFRVPMAFFTYVGMVAVMFFSTVGVQR